MRALKTGPHLLLTVIAGAMTFLGSMTAMCDDEGGVSSWERCNSWLGNPILEWPGGNLSPIFPLLLGIGVGYLVWRLLGKSGRVVWVTSIVVVIGSLLALAPFVKSIYTT